MSDLVDNRDVTHWCRSVSDRRLLHPCRDHANRQPTLMYVDCDLCLALLSLSDVNRQLDDAHLALARAVLDAQAYDDLAKHADELEAERDKWRVMADPFAKAERDAACAALRAIVDAKDRLARWDDNTTHRLIAAIEAARPRVKLSSGETP